MENKINTLVTLLRTSFMHELEIARSLLASHDIESYIVDKNLDLIIGTAYIEGYKLKVSTLDFERAKKILSDLKARDNS